MADLSVQTYESKQAYFDKAQLDLDIDDDLGDYFIICISPSSRWLLATLLNFYGEFHNRFENFTEREADQLVAETLLGLICPMACQEDFQLLISTIAASNVILTDIKDRLGDGNSDIEVRIEELGTEVAALTTSLEALGLPDLIDGVEEILNGVGVILGAPEVVYNGS